MEMTLYKALFIKLLRVRMGYTWRAVQREIWTRYEAKKPFNSQCKNPFRDNNQIDGANNCDKAMLFLNETISDGWN